MSIKLKKVFITGGSGSLGKSLIEEFHKKKYEIYFQYNSNDKKAKSIAKEFSATAIKINFNNEFELPEIDFDIIVNNLGINISDTISHEVSDSDWDETLKINVTIPFRICKFYLPKMIKKNWGRIININSIYGVRVTEYNTPYNVSKHALSGLTKSIAKEYGAHNITCNEICPGAIDSELMKRIASRIAEQENSTMDAVLSDVASEYPLKRLVKPNEVATSAVFLASEDASFVNGVSLVVDGGLIC
jgi:NAD(P)-dependent dehydrogenase (short-subunit alcohol dehydrogenase family)